MKLKQKSIPYLFLIPIFVSVALFRYVPTFMAIFRSFFYWDGRNISKFIGFSNYIDLINDGVFIKSLKNILVFSGVRLVFIILFSFVAAELIYNLNSKKWSYRWKVLFVAPMVVPWTVTLLIWQFIYSPQVGMLNNLLNSFGLDFLTQAWLGNSSTALISVAMVQFPFVATIQFLIIVSGLQNIPEAVKESAILDGATTIRRIISIDIPILKPQLILASLLTLINSFQRFAIFQVLTKGGPGNATQVPGYYLYQNAFNYGRFGYASAIGVILMLMLLAISYFNIRNMNSEL
ncbi:carbohydrate ABC transporter permease [Halanaerobium sp. ST460_2HS_T2]|uniref:carbohydrate ABC transporter permease n=1 Tax=Halanaerobium sp. ST460_2HS_T2 TaxID=2183914 RepID=UPI000DF1B082|nr:sugar ABC transporter permease [Halanaerobium sp. ST460_2HS_T2]RCW62461.1 raffinose/stachyose/melibiose transport system permease protein [Halanaerobium sp. ST460_2HS_T2]